MTQAFRLDRLACVIQIPARYCPASCYGNHDPDRRNNGEEGEEVSRPVGGRSIRDALWQSIGLRGLSRGNGNS